MRHKPFKIELCYSISNFMFRSRGQHEVRRSCWNRGREKIKLDVERFIDLTSKSHRSSTNSVISGTNSMGRGFILKFEWFFGSQTRKLHLSLSLKRSRKWTIYQESRRYWSWSHHPLIFVRKLESLYSTLNLTQRIHSISRSRRWYSLQITSL